jgi:peroxiredoxin
VIGFPSQRLDAAVPHTIKTSHPLIQKLVGRTVPNVHLAHYVDDHLIARPAAEFLGKGRAFVAGAPGAYTPLCSQRHIPNLVDNADTMRAAGIDSLYCIVTSDPFSLAAWARIVDPHGKIRFLSDGNLQFARTLGLTSREDSLFLGERSMRYALTLKDGVIQSGSVEASVLDFGCTSPEKVLELD